MNARRLCIEAPSDRRYSRRSARFDELPPRHKMRTSSGRAQHRCVGTATPLPALEPVVQGRAGYAEHFRSKGLIVELKVKNGGCHDAHHASVVCP